MKTFKFFKHVCVMIVIVASCFVTGCQKEDIMMENDDEFDNPYEYVGEYHNEGLSYILSKIESTVKLKSQNIDVENIEKQVYALTGEFCANNPLHGEIISIKEFEKISQTLKQIRLKSSQNQFSPIREKYYIIFCKLLKNSENSKSISNVLKKIKKIEQEIYYADMDNIDKESLLVAYAIGRNSLEFWTSSINIRNSTPKLKTGNEFDFLDWWEANIMPAIYDVVINDYEGAAWGGATGLILGGSVGSAVPGAGTITGAITGAVTGGAAGALEESARSGITKLASWIWSLF
jgi:hypothetical protein